MTVGAQSVELAVTIRSVARRTLSINGISTISCAMECR
jgi:hypothetical protein